MILVRKNINLALISKTWLKPSQNLNFLGYNIICTDRHDGVDVLLKNYISFVPLNTYYNIGNVMVVTGKII